MQAHHADLGITADEDAEGHGIIDGDGLDQRLASGHWCGSRLAGIHDDG
jgi:hypothetical protein